MGSATDMGDITPRVEVKEGERDISKYGLGMFDYYSLSSCLSLSLTLTLSLSRTLSLSLSLSLYLSIYLSLSIEVDWFSYGVMLSEFLYGVCPVR